MNKLLKSCLVFFFLLSLFTHQLQAQKSNVTVDGNIIHSKSLDGSYAYMVTGSSAETARFHKGQIKKNRFQIAFDQRYEDTLGWAFLFISPLATMNRKVYEQNVRSYKLHQFIIDTSQISVEVNVPAKWASITGGELNRLNRKFNQIDSLYFKMVENQHMEERYTYSGDLITDVNRYRTLAWIDLIKQYNNSLLSVDKVAWLAKMPAPKMTYQYRDEIRAALESLLPEQQASERVKNIYASFEANLKRNEPKSEFVFPRLALIDQNLKPYPFQELYADKQYVLLDFWATWCGPCIQQHPTIKQLSDQLKDSNIQVVGISIDQKPEAWSKYLTKHPFNYPQYKFDPSDKRMMDEIGVSKIPTYTLVEKSSGKVVEFDIPINELKSLLEKYSK